MIDSVRLYSRYVGISLRAQLQYRASFVMMTLGHFLVTLFEFFGIWAMFARFGSLRGWSLPEVALLYGIVSLAFALAEGIGRGFDTFHNLVKNGDFDRLLLRPRSTALQVAGGEVQLMRVGRLAQGLIVMTYALQALPVEWTAAKVGLLVASILGGACTFYGLFILQATLAFWTVESLEIVNTVTYGGTETAQYPLSIYQPWFRRFFTLVVPVACINYFPAHALLERSGGPPSAVQWLSPLVGPVFLLLCLQIWQLGVRHYRSTGS